MATGKALFPSKGIGELMEWQFSEKANEEIRTLYKNAVSQKEANDVWEMKDRNTDKLPEQLFVEVIEEETKWAQRKVIVHDREFLKKDILATLEKLQKQSNLLRDGLRSLSRSVDSLFPIEKDPKSHADYLDEVCHDIDTAVFLAQKAPRKVNGTIVRHKIAVEHAIRVLRIAKRYGMEIPNTCHIFSGVEDYLSVAIDLLFCIGHEIGLDYGKETWKKILTEAKITL